MVEFIILMAFTYLFLVGAVGKAMNITLSSPLSNIFFALFWIFFIPILLGALFATWIGKLWKK